LLHYILVKANRFPLCSSPCLIASGAQTEFACVTNKVKLPINVLKVTQWMESKDKEINEVYTSLKLKNEKCYCL